MLAPVPVIVGLAAVAIGIVVYLLRRRRELQAAAA
jgi:LPXTG-motif cell wall-anchored protein